MKLRYLSGPAGTAVAVEHDGVRRTGVALSPVEVGRFGGRVKRWYRRDATQRALRNVGRGAKRVARNMGRGLRGDNGAAVASVVPVVRAARLGHMVAHSLADGGGDPAQYSGRASEVGEAFNWGFNIGVREVDNG